MTIKKNNKNEGYEPIYSMVRLKPMKSGTKSKSCVEVTSRNQIRMIGDDEKKFFCNQVLDENTTQKEIFDIVGLKLVENLLAGYNGCLLTYGQTGAGKTYTAFGPEYDDNFSEQRGLIPRILQSIFREIEKEQEKDEDKSFLCKCSFLQIYNEHIYDLLDSSPANLSIGLDINKDVFVKGLQETEIDDTREAMEVIKIGSQNRRVSSTSMNRESSRSHAVFTITVQSQGLVDGVKVTRTAKLDLVDLAGSERQKHTNAAGATLKEACKINQSLSTLGKVIKSLIDHEKPPFRDSLLTHLLSNSLGGNSKTYFLANVHQGTDHFFETRSTLVFTQRMQLVQNRAVINEESHETIAQLKQKYNDLLLRLETNNIENSSEDINNAQELAQLAIQEKNKIQTEYEKLIEVKKLDDRTITLLNQKNQNIKMRMKFMETKNKKNETEIERELKQIISDLESSLKDNPEVTHYASKFYMVEHELKTLKAQYPNFSSDNVHIKELKQYIRQLEEHAMAQPAVVEEPEPAQPEQPKPKKDRRKSRKSGQFEDLEKWKLTQTVTDLEMELDNAKERIDEQKSRITDLQNELEEKTEELSTVKATQLNSNGNSNINSDDINSNGKNKENKENDNLTNDFNNENTGTSYQHTDSKAMEENTKEKLPPTEECLIDFDTTETINSSTGMISGKQTLNAVVVQDEIIKEIEQKLTIAMNQKQELESRVKELELQSKTSATELHDVQEKLDKAEQANIDLERQLNEAVQNLSIKESIMKEMQFKLNKLEKDKADLENRITTLSSEIEFKQNELNKEKLEHVTIIKSYTELEAKYGVVEHEKSVLLKAEKTLMSENQDLKNINESTVAENEYMKTELNEVKAALEEKSNTCTLLEQKNNDLLVELTSNENELQNRVLELTTKFQEIETNLREKTSIICGLEEQKSKLVDEYEFLKKNASTEREKLERLRLEIDERKNMNIKLEEEVKDSQSLFIEKQLELQQKQIEFDEKVEELCESLEQQKQLIIEHSKEKQESRNIIKGLEKMLDESELMSKLNVLTRRYEKLKSNYVMAAEDNKIHLEQIELQSKKLEQETKNWKQIATEKELALSENHKQNLEITALQKSLKDVTNDYAALGGNHNPSQRIRHFQRKLEDINNLSKENIRLAALLKKHGIQMDGNDKENSQLPNRNITLQQLN